MGEVLLDDVNKIQVGNLNWHRLPASWSLDISESQDPRHQESLVC
jgi:hypothetical protein